MAPSIPTGFLVVSDTHGDVLQHTTKRQVDVAVHCGDLTEESKLDDFRASIRLLEGINAPLKLVIPGNHDWTLDDTMFQKKIAEMKPSQEDLVLVEKHYGRFGEAKGLFDDARKSGIHILDEGIHRFELDNGAVLTVYASPYTQSVNDWGFQYSPQGDHVWNIDESVDLAITHSPPLGVLDQTGSNQRAGSAGLFAAIARARPQMHCYGHIHESWGSKLVTWREDVGEAPSHFTSIDNGESTLIERLSNLRPHKRDDPEDLEEKRVECQAYNEQGYCSVDAKAESGWQTLFVNAAIEGVEEGQQQWPWLTTLELPAA